MLPNPSEFVHLHVHSEGSLIDGLGTVQNLVQSASNAGFQSLALTEHGTLSTAISFSLECEKAGIKPILGIEGYIKVDGSVGHITVLADGAKGWNSLVALNNKAQLSQDKRPVFFIDDLIELNSGLIVLTGCQASPLQSHSLQEAVKIGALLKSEFGARLFSEIMFVTDAPESVERSLHLAEQLNLQLVVTNDVHFPLQEQAPIHPILTGMKSGFSYNSSQLWLKTPKQIAEYAKNFRELLPFSVLKEALELTQRIANRIQPVRLKRDIHLPQIPNLPDKMVIPFLRDKVNRFLKKGKYPAEYFQRAEYELSIIESMNFGNYFAILEDIIGMARNLGARIGPGRGSGVGSVVLFALGVTQIDPLEFGLTFERFLNPERAEFPDVDVDFNPCHRDKVLDAVAEKWGAYQIATQSTYNHKSLINDLTKRLKLPAALASQAAEKGEDSDEFKALCKARPEFKSAYYSIIGQIRHRGKHAGGIVLVDSESVLPFENVGGKLVAAWAEGSNREVSEAGFLKFDLLGITALDVLQQLEEVTGTVAPFPPKENDPVFSLFCSGNTTGIFQFSGSGIVELTKNVQPSNFVDLVTINALYRPGPLGAGTAENYVAWREKPRSIHPDFDSVLDETAGVIVFQEQVMSIVKIVMNGTMAQADNARKLFSKPKFGNAEWEAKIQNLKDEFLNMAIPKYGETLAVELWEELQTHSRYSFNKSHATAYSRIAWELAYFKYHFPVQFFVAILNNDAEKVESYIFNAAESGVKINPPNVNISSFVYEERNGEIFMPLSAVKWLGTSGAETIVNERESNGPFTSVKDFCSRVPKKKVNARSKRGLWHIGAFNGISGTVSDLAIEQQSITKEEAQKQFLGFIIPTKELIQQIEMWRNAGYIVGIVERLETRNKGKGDYQVLYLKPAGVGWKRGTSLYLDAGDYIRMKLNGNGQIQSVLILAH